MRVMLGMRLDGKTNRFGGAARRGAKAIGEQIDCAEEEVIEPHFEEVCGDDAQTNVPTCQGARQEDCFTAIADDAVAHDESREIAWTIIECDPLAGKNTLRVGVELCRSLSLEAFMGTHLVVITPPHIQRRLLRRGVNLHMRGHFCCDVPVQPFVRAVVLRMPRSAAFQLDSPGNPAR